MQLVEHCSVLTGLTFHNHTHTFHTSVNYNASDQIYLHFRTQLTSRNLLSLSGIASMNPLSFALLVTNSSAVTDSHPSMKKGDAMT